MTRPMRWLVSDGMGTKPLKIPKMPKRLLDCGNKHKCKEELGCLKHFKMWKKEILGKSLDSD